MSIWKEISGWPGYYVSDSGEVKSVCRGKERILRQCFDGSKHYLQVTLCKNGVHKRVQVHRLVAEAFVANKDPQCNDTVDHINCIKTDNRSCNLEWVTHTENMRRARKNGLVPNPPSFKGKFGKEHNKSIGYTIQNPAGVVNTYYSGLEFRRKTGLDNTTLSYAAIHCTLPYTFTRGKVKGYTLISVFRSYRCE